MNKRAQGITEYALIIGAVAAILLSMQVYFKRGVQSVVKVSLDQLGGFNSGISPAEVQGMGIEQRDPKYDELRCYQTQTSTRHSTTTRVDAKGRTYRTVSSVDKTKDGENVDGSKGKVFERELEY